MIKYWSNSTEIIPRTSSLRLDSKIMISDSAPWKGELLRISGRLEKRRTQKRWSEQSHFLTERDIMLAAYIIRKLMEAKKLSDDLTNRMIVIVQHPSSGSPPGLLTYERIWQNYDLRAGAKCTLSLRDLCNQVIHSFNWTTAHDEEGGLAGIFVSSDKARRKFLYFVGIELLVEILREVGYNDVVEVRMECDAEGELQVISLLGADTRTARYEWMMTSRSRGSIE